MHKKQDLLQEYIYAVLLHEEKVHQNIKYYDEIKALFTQFIEKFKDDASFLTTYGTKTSIDDKAKYNRAIGKDLVITTHVPELTSWAMPSATVFDFVHNITTRPAYITVDSGYHIMYRMRIAPSVYKLYTISKDKFASLLKIARTFEEFEILIKRMS